MKRKLTRESVYSAIWHLSKRRKVAVGAQTLLSYLGITDYPHCHVDRLIKDGRLKKSKRFTSFVCLTDACDIPFRGGVVWPPECFMTDHGFASCNTTN